MMRKSTDPFPGYRGIPSTMHPYNYCGNNPVNFIDPLGLESIWPDCDYDLEGITVSESKSKSHDYESVLDIINEKFFYAGDPSDNLGLIKAGSFENINPNQEALDFHNKLPPKPTSVDITMTPSQPTEYLVPPVSLEYFTSRPSYMKDWPGVDVQTGAEYPWKTKNQVYWESMYQMAVQDNYFLAPLIGGAGAYVIFGPKVGISTFVIVGSGTYMYMHGRASEKALKFGY